jgi:moderate conductance mechanosensitive channel
MAAAVLLQFSTASAQTEAPPAASPDAVQLSEEQVNQIVKSVTGAVLDELKATAAPPPAVPAEGPDANMEQGLASFMEEQGERFGENLEAALLALPALFAEIGRIIVRLDAAPEGRGALAFLALVASVIAGSMALAYAASAIASWLLPGSVPKGGGADIAQTLRRALANLAGAGLFWLLTSYASRKFFSGLDVQSLVGHWLLAGSAHFALFYTLFLIWFRPSEPAYRIVPLEARDAALAMRLFLIMLAVLVLRGWIQIPMRDQQPPNVITAGLLLNNLLFVSSFFLGALPARQAIRRWIENTSMSEQKTRFRRWLAANWLTLAGTAVILLSAIHAYGAVSKFTGVAAGLTGTVRMALVIILLCAFIEFAGRRSERADEVALRAIPKLPGVVSKMMRVFILLGSSIYFIRLWCVDALKLMTAEQWNRLAIYALEPLAAVMVAYIAVSYVNFLSARYLATHPAVTRSVTQDGQTATRPDKSSRLRTLVPILRITSIVIIIVMISLLVLSHLGFNITPLLAGASVIGLAVSFGSQALVKDIVSGVLFLAEDSFRVGEHIACGSSKGTVDGFTLRSLRLRHPDGQIYTVPFGQIGEIINYSRDWATVKFNMSLDRDVDLDDVRRVTRAVADELKTDFKDRLLDSLQVQGVKDVTDNAIVVQFNFTALPNDPGEIERMARSRLFKAFKDEGIALSRHPWYATAAGQPA